MTNTKQDLADLGEFLGIDGTAFVKIRTTYLDFEELASNGNTLAIKALEALELTANIMRKVASR